MNRRKGDRLIASEGKLVTVMHRHPLGQVAAIIGEVRADEHRFVGMKTVFGGNRLVGWLSSDPLRRIC